MSGKKGYSYFDSYFDPKDDRRLPIESKYRSNSVKAKNIVRAEIFDYYGGNGKKTAFESMTRDIKASYDGNRMRSSYGKAKTLVDSGCFACYHSQQAKMLAKIYGKKKVDKMNGNQVHELYKHLIAREYSDMDFTGNHGYIKNSKKHTK